MNMDLESTTFMMDHQIILWPRSKVQIVVVPHVPVVLVTWVSLGNPLGDQTNEVGNGPRGWILYWKPKRHVSTGHYEIKPPIYKKFLKKNKCIHSNNMLENGLIYLY